MCLYPKLIQNRKYIKNKKNGGNIPAVPDERVKLVPVGCGRCMECKKKKARDWAVRLHEEIKQNKNGKFITLTFSNESIKQIICKGDLQHLEGYELDNAIATWAMRHFLERWRKKYKKSLRHWFVTELGHNGTENIHMHGLVWTDQATTEIRNIWQYGYVWIGNSETKENYVNGRTVSYITKYVLKVDATHKMYNSITLCSHGIGSGYTKSEQSKSHKYSEKETNESYRLPNGAKSSLPIYYRNKLFTEQQREQLWLNKLDEGIRYVGGEKVAANDDKTYWGLVEWYRKINNRLGYGNDEKDWNREVYERERRKLLYEKRLANTKKQDGH